ncbi:hypothetical protein ACIQFU_09765 [Streptomyces sp. NPDC093065]|uniref:hypothetical protein n=1 Tax=Streptomyces sp. NPDC093065 TaxID=3366021 RepID=UPI003817DB1F
MSSVVAVIGMPAFLGACFATSMWPGSGAAPGPDPRRRPLPAPPGAAFLLIPVVSRLLHRVAASWLLTSGFVLMAVGCLLCTRLDVTDPRFGPFVAPALLIGVGFALTVSSVTAVALNSVPRQLAGMAGATTGMLRDLGFALGPVVVGAVAVSNAGSHFAAKLTGADLPAGQAAAARTVAEAGGPVAVNSLPPGAPGSAAHALALDALGSGFGTAFLVCGVAAAVAAALTAFGMIGVHPHRSTGSEEPDAPPAEGRGSPAPASPPGRPRPMTGSGAEPEHSTERATKLHLLPSLT